MDKLYHKITQLNGPVKYTSSGRGHLCMEDYLVPLSIMEKEFFFIRDQIISNDLKTGFEVATAFGISALAAGLGFKETGGHLVSMDAYIEEKIGNAGVYSEWSVKDFIQLVLNDHPKIPIGLKSAIYLRDYFQLEDHISFFRGWSPDSTEIAIKNRFKNVPLDYAFVDAGHFTEWIKRDIEAIAPHLGKRFIVFFHDVYSESFTSSLIEYIENLLGNKLEIVLEYPYGENLGMIKVGY